MVDVINRHIFPASRALGELDRLALVKHSPQRHYTLAQGVVHAVKVVHVVGAALGDFGRYRLAVVCRTAADTKVPSPTGVAGRLVRVRVEVPATTVTANGLEATMVEHAGGAQVSCTAIIARRDFARVPANKAEHDRVVLLDVCGDNGLGRFKVIR